MLGLRDVLWRVCVPSSLIGSKEAVEVSMATEDWGISELVAVMDLLLWV